MPYRDEYLTNLVGKRETGFETMRVGRTHRLHTSYIATVEIAERTAEFVDNLPATWRAVKN